MSIPEFTVFFKPVLEILGDRRPRGYDAVEAALVDEFNLSEEDRNELLPSGTQRRLRNRVAWSLSYLNRAGLVSRPKRGLYQITEKGLTCLADGDLVLDAKAMAAMGGYTHGEKTDESNGNREPGRKREPDLLLTPEEQMETGYQSARQQLSDEIRERLRAVSPSRFEQLVVDLLVAMGYGGASGEAGQVIGKTGDDGIDGVIKEDKLGLDHVYIQAKRWESNLPRPIVQAFAGSLEGQRARKGVMITTSDFTKDAQDYVKRIEKRIVLINGELLANYMIDHQIGVATVKTYELKRIDNDYFEEG